MFHVQLEIARHRQDDLVRRAEGHRRRPSTGRRTRLRFRRPEPRSAPSVLTSDVRLRAGFPDDMDALAALARSLDGRVPPQPVLLAEIDGELKAARSLRDGARLAGRDACAAELLDLLDVRADQLRRARSGRVPAGR